MYLIVGLGNPGVKYKATRHNLGFIFAEKLAESLSQADFELNKKLKSQIAKTDNLVIAKPQTFMNLSGDAAFALERYYDALNTKIIIISDDCNLDVGQIRIRFSGSDGGHNGLKSIISKIGSDFWRIRIGIGSNGQIPLENYVLQKTPGDEYKRIEEGIDKSVKLLIESISKDNLENKTLN